MISNSVVHELKYIVSNSRAHDILNWLGRYCEPDHEFPEGLVSSIYYDTAQWKFMGEKIDSFYLKTKVRLRWYSDLDYREHGPVSFVEAKFKIGSRREKVRVITPLSGTEAASLPLESPRLIEVPHLLRSEGVVLREKLLPAFQITYKRFRYLDPFTGSRICFDFDIFSPRTNRVMTPFLSSVKLQTAVFEVKGPEEELPVSLYPLTDMGLKKSAFSKYSACYQKLSRRHY